MPPLPATTVLRRLEARLDALCSNLDDVPYNDLSIVEKLLMEDCAEDIDVENPHASNPNVHTHYE
ncbi:hypothetical protein SPRG_14844 [Saprolegnia parasitica CBS 223.65]|uniref:Uncharacterized protein n=1 Tax=Saprolegnia parasitica (strain CBS 223.65) TaxID=695850 RepID=A0A067BZC6_SAPPC|nr:hypothetical protein SPRG_14844 [Saprolegnia parasitica CBS 223.65]KDO19937.1 hypothetical protein SPRG_14844 [Saprolegnia parasitica CBS 223.65]|eukprot:XP_012209375.1 hypothetical protein SPRG_14844 [Saprolegnia parasitica CBS 223.65]